MARRAAVARQVRLRPGLPASAPLTDAMGRRRVSSFPMSFSETSIATDPVQQFSVFVYNQVGRLNDLIALLQSHNVHVMAITVLDTTDSAIVRMVVDDPEKARQLMHDAGFPWKEADVLVVEINDESEIAGVLAALLEAEVNIHYIYSFIKRPQGKAALALNVEDPEVAAQALNHRSIRVLTQHDISR